MFLPAASGVKDGSDFFERVGPLGVFGQKVPTLVLVEQVTDYNVRGTKTPKLLTRDCVKKFKLVGVPELLHDGIGRALPKHVHEIILVNASHSVDPSRVTVYDGVLGSLVLDKRQTRNPRPLEDAIRLLDNLDDAILDGGGHLGAASMEHKTSLTGKQLEHIHRPLGVFLEGNVAHQTLVLVILVVGVDPRVERSPRLFGEQVNLIRLQLATPVHVLEKVALGHERLPHGVNLVKVELVKVDTNRDARVAHDATLRAPDAVDILKRLLDRIRTVRVVTYKLTLGNTRRLDQHLDKLFHGAILAVPHLVRVKHKHLLTTSQVVSDGGGPRGLALVHDHTTLIGTLKTVDNLERTPQKVGRLATHERIHHVHLFRSSNHLFEFHPIDVKVKVTEVPSPHHEQRLNLIEDHSVIHRLVRLVQGRYATNQVLRLPNLVLAITFKILVVSKLKTVGAAQTLMEVVTQTDARRHPQNAILRGKSLDHSPRLVRPHGTSHKHKLFRTHQVIPAQKRRTRRRPDRSFLGPQKLFHGTILQDVRVHAIQETLDKPDAGALAAADPTLLIRLDALKRVVSLLAPRPKLLKRHIVRLGPKHNLPRVHVTQETGRILNQIQNLKRSGIEPVKRIGTRQIQLGNLKNVKRILNAGLLLRTQRPRELSRIPRIIVKTIKYHVRENVGRALEDRLDATIRLPLIDTLHVSIHGVHTLVNVRNGVNGPRKHRALVILIHKKPV